MKRLFLWPFSLIMLLTLGGCSQLLLRQTCVGLATDINYCLAPLPLQDKDLLPKDQAHGASQPAGQSGTQKVNLQLGETQHELLGQMVLTPQRLTLVGLAPLGQPLFSLDYDGVSLQSEQSLLLGDEFRAEYLMALMQLMYWPLDSINASLKGGALVQEPCHAVLCRVLYPDGGKEQILSIDYSHRDPWQARIHLRIPAVALSMTVTPLDS
ncbi:DUF3261 domain-containing protein [Shewanella sedimentimangrovi]|uniref:DUF3261 domain-containing protein n=1 Tax=Shewanella sedimentimangrovi TaxID=2814293 RepID=A0ABX7R2I4_9GAMM|nr:DUF3261 domain-containing protein [Shewanella sedimentimangrovi]QSX37055.1 DUF3261 domain-containing protein [Shewanella sedimentimangrovi]